MKSKCLYTAAKVPHCSLHESTFVKENCMFLPKYHVKNQTRFPFLKLFLKKKVPASSCVTRNESKVIWHHKGILLASDNARKHHKFTD